MRDFSRQFVGFLLALFTVFWMATAMAQNVQEQSPTEVNASLITAPEVAARAFMVLDITTNQILLSKDIDAPVEPASLTKLMTAYVVYDALRAKKISLDQLFSVSERAWKMPGSRMFITPKMQVPVDDLIKGMIVQSGNDATVALAEGVAGSVEVFVQRMNAQAQILGMKATTYKNPEGLTDAGHITTARDLSILATRLLRDFPEYAHYDSIKKYFYPGTPPSNATNRNTLLFRDPTVDGLKTGHTEAAGYCLIATAKRDFAQVGGRRILTIVLGADSDKARINESQKLLNWAYTAFDMVKLFEANQAVLSPAIWKGAAATLRLGRTEAVLVAVPAGSAARLKTQVERPDPLVAPILKGQTIGTLKLELDQQAYLEIPLVALDDVPMAGLFGRAWDALKLWIK